MSAVSNALSALDTTIDLDEHGISSEDEEESHRSENVLIR